jgi:hypothetical protein
MHGPTFQGNGEQALVELGDEYERRTRAALDRLGAP